MSLLKLESNPMQKLNVDVMNMKKIQDINIQKSSIAIALHKSFYHSHHKSLLLSNNKHNAHPLLHSTTHYLLNIATVISTPVHRDGTNSESATEISAATLIASFLISTFLASLSALSTSDGLIMGGGDAISPRRYFLLSLLNRCKSFTDAHDIKNLRLTDTLEFFSFF